MGKKSAATSRVNTASSGPATPPSEPGRSSTALIAAGIVLVSGIAPDGTQHRVIR